jgi:hypothetical protein
MSQTTRITEPLLSQLRMTKLSSVFRGTEATIDGRSIERDGRRRPAVIRRLLQSKLIRKITEKEHMFTIIESVLDEIDSVEIDLMAIWTSNYTANNKRQAYHRPWILLEKLTVPEQWAVLNEQTCDWFVVAVDPYRYMHDFAEVAEAPDDPKRIRVKFSRYWSGPHSELTHARSKLRSAPGTVIAVSSDELRTEVQSYHVEQHRQWQFANNLLFGLVELELVPAFLLLDDHGKPLIDRQLNEGFAIRGVSVEPEHADEVRWESNLRESIARVENSIRKRQETLHILNEVSTAISRFGGWHKFKQSFWDMLDTVPNAGESSQ